MGNSGAAQFVALLNKLSLVVFIVAVILVVYLIARCIRISNRRSSITFHSHGARRNHSAEENPSIIDMPVGLHREFVEALPIFVYEPEKMKIGLECAVCLGEFQENDKEQKLKAFLPEKSPNCLLARTYEVFKVVGMAEKGRRADMDEPKPLPKTVIDIAV
ncbi:hypothetical protein SUGI_0786460 [Cryptomeria japonica]|nr:hypothetical protein SUGI_0786460 [Cryptomeria japonica]